MTQSPEYKRAWRTLRVTAGVCTRCGLYPAAPGLQNCEGCHAKHLAYSVSYKRRKRAEAKEKGICTVCLKRFAVEGLVTCDYCSDQNRQYLEKKRCKAKKN